MSKPSVLELHKPEEEISIEIENSLSKCALPVERSPIEDYFNYTQGLIARFVKPEFSGDVETLSLLLLGVVSAAEFYFRTVLVRSLDICPLARRHAERVQIPLGSLGYYGAKTAALGLSIFEHKSLAGGQFRSAIHAEALILRRSRRSTFCARRKCENASLGTSEVKEKDRSTEEGELNRIVAATGGPSRVWVVQRLKSDGGSLHIRLERLAANIVP